MKAATAILILLVLAVVCVLLIGRFVRSAWRRRSERRAPWQMVEESDGEQLCIYASRPGNERLLIGAAAFAARDFEQDLYELRAVGREKVYALNQKGRP